jgi:uncharacterized protein (DUF433 family)
LFEQTEKMTVIIKEETVESLPISVNAKIMSGTLVLERTRVPIEALLENLAAGVSLDQFLENLPT